MALNERDLVLGVRPKLDHFLKSWRKRTAKAVVEAFQMVKKKKIRAYREYSYFAHHYSTHAVRAKHQDPSPNYNEEL